MIDLIIKEVCREYNITPEKICSKTHKREVVLPRQICFYLAKKYTKKSLSSIGQAIGNKDHATVLHACKTVNDIIDTDKEFRNIIIDLDRRIKEAIENSVTPKQWVLNGLNDLLNNHKKYDNLEIEYRLKWIMLKVEKL